jgi:hypothetical protein
MRRATNRRHHQRSDTKQKRLEVCRNQAGKGNKRLGTSHLVLFAVYTHLGIAVGMGGKDDAVPLLVIPREQLEFKTLLALSRCCHRLDRRFCPKPPIRGSGAKELMKCRKIRGVHRLLALMAGVRFR